MYPRYWPADAPFEPFLQQSAGGEGSSGEGGMAGAGSAFLQHIRYYPTDDIYASLMWQVPDPASVEGVFEVCTICFLELLQHLVYGVDILDCLHVQYVCQLPYLYYCCGLPACFPSRATSVSPPFRLP